MFNVNKQQTKITEEVNYIVNTIFENKDNDAFYHKGVFNTKNLPNHNNYKYFPNIDKDFREIIFEKLDNIKKNHCLYWFELESNEKTKELNSLLDTYRSNANTKNYKKVPASNKNEDTNILYLGIR